MRMGIGEYRLGFWWAKTSNGFSVGPLIHGEEHIHSTVHIDGKVINAHLTTREHREHLYRNLVTMTMNDLQSKAKLYEEWFHRNQAHLTSIGWRTHYR